MRRTLNSLLLPLLLLAVGCTRTASVPKEVTMEKDVLMDKIRGAWAGQVIGCTYGGPTEFKYANFISDEQVLDWNDDIIKWWYDHSPGL